MNKPNWSHQTIWTGDNLDIMRGMNSASVDLIYLDPPFKSDANYVAPIGSKAAGAAFKDTWGLNDINLAWHGQIKYEHPDLYATLEAVRKIHSDSMMSYLIYMTPRIMEMKRILKETGNIYLHCDPHASHYLKLMMDAIFGRKFFRNEIVWERIKGAGKKSKYQSKSFGKSHDLILLYVKSPQTKLNLDAVATPYSEEQMKKFNRRDDKGVYYRRSPFRAPGLGAAPNCCFEYKGVKPPHASGWIGAKRFIIELDKNGGLEWVNDSVYRKQRPGKGITPNSVWTDIDPVSGKEDLGYPTQKPLKLLERIIAVSTQEGNVILDPFCGCATACVAAEKLGRKWGGGRYFIQSRRSYSATNERRPRLAMAGNTSNWYTIADWFRVYTTL